MSKKPEISDLTDKDEKTSSNVSEHLANERTFLAWVRTGIGIMAFGFVVVKFSIFIFLICVLLIAYLVISLQ